MANLRARLQRPGLVKRIVILSVGLLLLIQIAVQLVVRSSIDESVRQNLQRELASDQKVWARLVDQNAQRLQLGASVLASDFGFKQAIASGDVPTIESALDNSGERIGATISAFLDPDFNLKAMANAQDAEALGQTLTLLSRAMARDLQQGSMAVELGRLHQFVMVPVKAPLVVGWVVMGFAVDKDLAAELNALSGTHVVLLNRAAGASQKIIHSTLGPAEKADIDTLLGNAAVVSLASDDYAALRVDIGSTERPLQVVLLRSTAEAKAVFARMQTVLLLIAALGLVLFAMGSFVMARRVSRPLDLLVADTERLGRGDYSQPVQDFGQKDEVGNLARSFDRMRINIQNSQAEIRKLAYWDSLTGLPNRAQFREAVQAQLDGDGPSQLAVIILDVDRLKHINDVLGYAFGDRILQAVAGRLQGVARDGQHLVARLAGGEFAFLLPGADVPQALAMAATIARAFEAPVALEGQTVDLSAGMGIASWPADADQADILLGRAEVAMYVAKHKSLGVQVYDPSLDSASAQTLSLLSELRQAIDGHQLRLFLQPKISLQSHQVVGAEALVRWQHPTRGMVQPMLFIPFAEQTGFVRHLTLWMLEETARQWKGLQPESGMLRIAVNLSTRDLMDPDFPAKVDSILARHGVPHSGFCLEITESAIMDDPQRAETTLNQLSASGYKLSIDDFGTGYSSLAYLKRLPVNELKIDKSFVMGMETDESDLKIVRSTIDLAHNLGLTVVAEGVEDRQIYQLLANSQCDEAQGYHMSRPILCTEFLDWCENWYGGHSQMARL